MKTTFTTISGNTFTTNEQGNYFYMVDITGKKYRIKKSEFEAAQREDALEKLNREQNEKNGFVNISEEDIESKIAEIEESETTEEIEEIQRKMAQEEAKEDAEDTQNTKAPVPTPDAKKTPKKAKKNTRKKKAQVGGFEFQEGEVHLILTPKQVDFLKHLSGSPFWQDGVQSTLWVDGLCDEITGQFKDKPMTVGAMISTLCEKGLGRRATERKNGRKCTSFALTEMGKRVAKELGLE